MCHQARPIHNYDGLRVCFSCITSGRANKYNDNLNEKELKKNKALVFVEHIEKHIQDDCITSHGGLVVCKICEKDINTIYGEEWDC